MHHAAQTTINWTEMKNFKMRNNFLSSYHMRILVYSVGQGNNHSYDVLHLTGELAIAESSQGEMKPWENCA